MTAFEQAHAASILQPATVEPIPPLKHVKVLVASVVRKPPEVLRAWLESLSWQKFRDPQPEVAYAFLANFAPTDPFKDEGLALLKESGALVVEEAAPVGDYGDGERTRMWSQSSFERLGNLKNNLLQLCLTNQFDAIWLVDADVLCDPYTLQSLLDSEAPITSAVYWTNWQRKLYDSAEFVHAGPQVWLRHPYVLDDARFSEPEFRAVLINRRRVQVGGLGACTLIHRGAIEKGVSFAKVPEIAQIGGMWDGEDRHFCLRAQRLHVPLMADPWSDVAHAYHPVEYGNIPEWMRALRDWPHFPRPQFGHLVSLKLDPLEPVQDAFGRFHHLGSRWVRGKFGVLPVMPEIEEAVGGLNAGEAAIVKVHYPVHYELPTLRNATRIFRVTLLDCKAFRYAPIIDAELFQAGASQRYLDATTLTQRQAEDMTAVTEPVS